jgi:hypothetical protein
LKVVLQVLSLSARRPATVEDGVCKEKVDLPKVKKRGENRNE